MARLKGFQKLTFVNDALEKWFNVLQIEKPRESAVPLNRALNRILVADVIAKEDLPRFDKSAVDGYAVKSTETIGASQFKPFMFQITESEVVGSKQARQIWTGNAIPKGANAVVMIEHTKKIDGNLEVGIQVATGGNVSRKGEDVKKDERILRAGTRLTPYHLALLAAMGKNEIQVSKKPLVAILATGNELADVGSELLGNQIFDSNRVMLAAMCREIGAEPVDLGIAKDDMTEIGEKLKQGLHDCDVVITTGGTSVGGLDLVPDVVNNSGKPGVVVHGLALRPAMPTAVAALNGKPVLILSGNPVAAVIGFEVFARPLICRMLGMGIEEPRLSVNAVMTRNVAAALGRRTFVRVRVVRKNGEFHAEPVSARGSGAISTMTRANGFVVVPENRGGIIEGEIMLVRLFGTVEEVS
ncbi:molybdopterin molybdotransferase MoeA [Candidatus Bathyarchaeota archaeon]|nr:molybdopterin molybdotransferase MoeA [Candidatus Bathyarchaeota archaeon]